MLKEAFPNISQIGLLPFVKAQLQLPEPTASAAGLGLKLLTAQVQRLEDIHQAVAALAHADAWFVQDEVLYDAQPASRRRRAGQATQTGDLPARLLRRIGGLMSLLDRHRRPIPPRRDIRRPHPARREAGRAGSGGADAIRAGDQHEDGEGARTHDAEELPAACRQGDRMKRAPIPASDLRSVDRRVFMITSAAFAAMPLRGLSADAAKGLSHRRA